jgi:hypothetical protein
MFFYICLNGFISKHVNFNNSFNQNHDTLHCWFLHRKLRCDGANKHNGIFGIRNKYVLQTMFKTTVIFNQINKY